MREAASALSAARGWVQSRATSARAAGASAKLRVVGWLQSNPARDWARQNSGIVSSSVLLLLLGFAAIVGALGTGATHPWWQSALTNAAFLLFGAVATLVIVNVVVERNERAKSANVEALLRGQARRLVGRVLLACTSTFLPVEGPPPPPRPRQSADAFQREMERQEQERRQGLRAAIDDAWNAGPFQWWWLLHQLDELSDRANRIAASSRGILSGEVEILLLSIADAIDFLLDAQLLIDDAMKYPVEIRQTGYYQWQGRKYTGALRRIIENAYAVQDRTPRHSQYDPPRPYFSPVVPVKADSSD